jgi:hypothetical protein
MDLARVLIVDLSEQPNALKEQTLWAYEQALRFPDCGAALLWIGDVSDLHLRRLQLAAEAGRTWGIVFRPERFGTCPSPAPLRLGLRTCRETQAVTERRDALQVTVLKARGGQGGVRCRVEL